MIKAFVSRLKQGHRTSAYPRKEVSLPPRYRGRPAFQMGAVLPDDRGTGYGFNAAEDVCPTRAIDAGLTAGTKPTLDMGLCIFCGACASVGGAQAGEGTIRFSGDYRLSASKREDLVIPAAGERAVSLPEGSLLLEKKIRRLFRRSLMLRQVSAGGCNACEADINVLNTLFFDIGRFGIQMVASPRHADGIIVTGPVSKNMEEALLKTWEAVPSPKIVIAAGACAISGGLFAESDETRAGVASLLPVDLFIPGCPPHPMTILHGLLGMLGRL